ncbi:MAG: response regulator [Anaerolineales bacterium]|nr:response regulator [Anaerolineales bacterium]
MESEPGRGSRFAFTLPLIPAEAQPAPGPPGRSALIVDDPVTAGEQLARYRRELGAEVVIEPHGPAVGERAAALQTDVILLDLLMPGQSGWEVLAALKADPRTRPVPVIIISILDERARGLAAGAAEYLVKPPSRGALHAALSHALTEPAAPAAQPEPAAPAADEPAPLLLLAEDNLPNQRAAQTFLQAKGYRVAVASDGIEAMAQARALRPALILMDVQMPGLDGLEATRQLRAEREFAQTPIIALTALAMPGDRERCLEAGANAYLTKPVSLKKLVEVVAEWLGAPPPRPDPSSRPA